MILPVDVIFLGMFDFLNESRDVNELNQFYSKKKKKKRFENLIWRFLFLFWINLQECIILNFRNIYYDF